MKLTILNIGSYSIFIGSNALKDINNFLTQPRYKHSKIFILVDEHNMKHCLPKLIVEVKALKDAEIIEIESGEESKNIEICSQIWRTLSELEADRKSLLVNLGGGVISDIGGFTASTYKRGIDYINIPTTLLAQVDASYGGKTGLNLEHHKNEIGVFSNPKAVFIYPSFLKTLSKKQILSGFAEIIKHALIADKNYWDLIRSETIADIKNWEPIICRSIEIKNKIVLDDPKEKGYRKALNFGHTIGHAIESYFMENADLSNKQGHAIAHGEAIGVGMICEAYLSVQNTSLKLNELDQITKYLFSIYGSLTIDAQADNRLIELMKYDKKNENKTIKFTLLSKIGKAEINKSCEIELIREALNYYRKLK